MDLYTAISASTGSDPGSNNIPFLLNRVPVNIPARNIYRIWMYRSVRQVKPIQTSRIH
jgi:hypothetical protein